MGLTLLSQNVLADSIAALGLTIAFYYGINGYAVPLFYRHQVLQSCEEVRACCSCFRCWVASL